jgi:hypothetical protein
LSDHQEALNDRSDSKFNKTRWKTLLKCTYIYPEKKNVLESGIPLSHQEALENRSRVDSENIDKKEDEDEDTKGANVLRIQLLFDKLLL